MLTITIINDCTGVDPLANYTYLVRSNYCVIAQGRIEGHNRADGWKALALEAVAPGMLEACEVALDWMTVGIDHFDGEPMPKAMLATAIAKVEGEE